MKILKKRHVTLVEIMIVMTLIALIIGALAFNIGGTLEKGNAFKTKTGMEKLETILSLAVAENPAILDDLPSDWKSIASKSPLVKDPTAATKDGWGQEYDVQVEDGKIIIRSEKYEEYLRTQK